MSPFDSVIRKNYDYNLLWSGYRGLTVLRPVITDNDDNDDDDDVCINLKTQQTSAETWTELSTSTRPYLLLDELVPVLVRERVGADDEFIPVSFDVVVARLLRYPHPVELQTARNLLLALEHHQRYLQAVQYNHHYNTRTN